MTKRQPDKRGAAISVVTPGSGNVFADIGLPNPERHLAKAQLVWLPDFLTALGRDVEIVVRPAPKSRKRGRLHVAA